MDIEFHYYITYLVARKAGFTYSDASILATSSQYVDDNDVIFEIDKGLATAYRNYISQTMNILKPKKKLFRIYPIFHFIPGDPQAMTARRKDGKMHCLNTTPNSPVANTIFRQALESRDLYRIGIAAHGYVDTWAHQNFVGYYEPFNALASPLAKVLPNIGHADAEHDPDWPALVWKDTRLLDERVVNKDRFLEAAGCLFEKLFAVASPAVAKADFAAQAAALRHDLSVAIGEQDQSNRFRDERIARYIALSGTAAYGGVQLSDYDPDSWFDVVVNEQVRGLRDRTDSALRRLDPLTDVYTWKDKATYRQSDWFRFQEAVKTHQDETWEILESHNFASLELPDL